MPQLFSPKDQYLTTQLHNWLGQILSEDVFKFILNYLDGRDLAILFSLCKGLRQSYNDLPIPYQDAPNLFEMKLWQKKLPKFLKTGQPIYDLNEANHRYSDLEKTLLTYLSRTDMSDGMLVFDFSKQLAMHWTLLVSPEEKKRYLGLMLLLKAYLRRLSSYIPNAQLYIAESHAEGPPQAVRRAKCLVQWADVFTRSLGTELNIPISFTLQPAIGGALFAWNPQI